MNSNLSAPAQVVVFTASIAGSSMSRGRLLNSRLALLQAGTAGTVLHGEPAWLAITESPGAVTARKGTVRTVEHDVDESGPLQFVELDGVSAAPSADVDADMHMSRDDYIARLVRLRADWSESENAAAEVGPGPDPVGNTLSCILLHLACPKPR